MMPYSPPSLQPLAPTTDAAHTAWASPWRHRRGSGTRNTAVRDLTTDASSAAR
jgi:hypothetical protein